MELLGNRALRTNTAVGNAGREGSQSGDAMLLNCGKSVKYLSGADLREGMPREERPSFVRERGFPEGRVAVALDAGHLTSSAYTVANDVTTAVTAIQLIPVLGGFSGTKTRLPGSGFGSDLKMRSCL